MPLTSVEGSFESHKKSELYDEKKMSQTIDVMPSQQSPSLTAEEKRNMFMSYKMKSVDQPSGPNMQSDQSISGLGG